MRRKTLNYRECRTPKHQHRKKLVWVPCPGTILKVTAQLVGIGHDETVDHWFPVKYVDRLWDESDTRWATPYVGLKLKGLRIPSWLRHKMGLSMDRIC